MTFNKYAWIEEVESNLIQLAQENDYNTDDVYEALCEIVDNECIYYNRAWGIAMELADPSGWDQYEFGPITSISQLAYAALYEYAIEKIDPVEIIKAANDEEKDSE